MYFQHFPKVQYDIDGSGFLQNIPNITAFSTIFQGVVDDVAYYNYYNIQDGDRPDNVSYLLYDTPNFYWTFFLINDHLNNVYDDWPKGSQFFDKWLRTKYSNLAAQTVVTPTHHAPNDVAGRFNVGELCQGSQSGAVGTIVAKFPTLGYLEIEPISGTFFASGETVLGLTSEDNITASAITPLWMAPHHYTDDRTGEQTRRKLRDTTAVSILQYERERELENSLIRVIKREFIQRVIFEFKREMALQ